MPAPAVSANLPHSPHRKGPIGQNGTANPHRRNPDPDRRRRPGRAWRSRPISASAACPAWSSSKAKDRPTIRAPPPSMRAPWSSCAASAWPTRCGRPRRRRISRTPRSTAPASTASRSPASSAPITAAEAPTPDSPERPQRCNQLWLDPILRDLASAQASVELRYRCRFETLRRRATASSPPLHDLATATSSASRSPPNMSSTAAAATARSAGPCASA